MRCVPLMLLFVSTIAMAQNNAVGTGYELQQQCVNGKEQVVLEAICNGYIVGAAEGLAYMRAPRLFCMPGTAMRGQIVQVVVKFLNDNPERLHFTAEALVLQALSAAFPCRKE